MASIKVFLNDELVFNPSDDLLAEKGFLVSVESKVGVPLGSGNDEQELVLQALKKHLSEDVPTELDLHQLKVGDKITIWGDLS